MKVGERVSERYSERTMRMEAQAGGSERFTSTGCLYDRCWSDWSRNRDATLWIFRESVCKYPNSCPDRVQVVTQRNRRWWRSRPVVEQFARRRCLRGCALEVLCKTAIILILKPPNDV